MSKDLPGSSTVFTDLKHRCWALKCNEPDCAWHTTGPGDPTERDVRARYRDHYRTVHQGA